MTKSYTALGLLGDNFPNGTQARVTTDNDFYGITVEKRNGLLVNVRDNQPLVLHEMLLKTKFKIVNTDQEVTLLEFLAAYKENKKLKVEMPNGAFRYIQKESNSEEKAVLQLMKQIAPSFVQAASGNEIISFDELLEGKFYIVK